MKEYTIVIPSNAGTGTAANELNYKFNWSIIPEGEYHLSFTFISEPLKTFEAVGESANQASQIEMVIPFSSDNYKVQTNGDANSSNVIGLLEVDSVDGIWTSGTDFSMRHWKSKNDNPSLHLYGRPTGMNFQVRLVKTNGDLATNHPTKYDMIVKLKHVC